MAFHGSLLNQISVKYADWNLASRSGEAYIGTTLPLTRSFLNEPLWSSFDYVSTVRVLGFNAQLTPPCKLNIFPTTKNAAFCRDLTPMTPLYSPQLFFVSFCDDLCVPHLYTYAIGMKLVKECIECTLQVTKLTVLLVEEFEVWTGQS